jgi:membrane protease YdiL (CAAX protease family)
MKGDSDIAVKSDPPTRLSALIGLVVAFGWPLLLLIPGLSTHQITNIHDDIVNVSVKWLVVIVLCVIAFAVQRRGPSELGMRMLGWRDGLAALGGVIVAFILSGAAGRIVAMPSSLTDLHKIAAVPLNLRIAVVLTAAVCEEFMYRGFGIEEIAYVIGKRWLAGLLSLILFTFSHAGLYGMSATLIIPALVGAVLTGLYLWRRNLPSCMLMHAVMDAIFIIVIPAMVQAK